MYKSILVPVDLAHTERVGPMFEKASALRDPAGKITIVHIVPVMPSYVSSAMPPGLSDSGVKIAREKLETLVKDKGLDADVIVKNGVPANALLSMAETAKTDLIIVASHDPNFSDYFLGSTAAKIVRHAHCSVLVMR